MLTSSPCSDACKSLPCCICAGRCAMFTVELELRRTSIDTPAIKQAIATAIIFRYVHSRNIASTSRSSSVLQNGSVCKNQSIIRPYSSLNRLEPAASIPALAANAAIEMPFDLGLSAAAVPLASMAVAPSSITIEQSSAIKRSVSAAVAVKMTSGCMNALSATGAFSVAETMVG